LYLNSALDKAEHLKEENGGLKRIPEVLGGGEEGLFIYRLKHRRGEEGASTLERDQKKNQLGAEKNLK